MKTEKPKIERATLNVYEAAQLAGCHHKLIRKYVAAGLIPRLSLTRTILIPRQAFMRFLENAGQPVE